jgi:general secretion pathway protein K
VSGSDRGFALIAVLLVLALLGVVGGEFAYSMRLEASSVRAYKDSVIATHLAEAAVAQAIREIVAQFDLACMSDDGEVTFYTRDGRVLPRLARKKVPLGPGQFSYKLDDEERLLNLNTSRPDRVDRLLQVLGVEKADRDIIGDSLLDWRDANEEHRVNGAESEDTYLKLPVPYRSRNGNLESVRELLQIKGVTPALYYGSEGRPGLATAVTVRSPGRVNLNTADVLVLKALGVSDAEIIQLLQTRRDGCFVTLPARGTIAGRGFVLTSRTFRVTAEGLVDGQVRARITAVLQKRSTAGSGAGVVVLDWSTSEEAPAKVAEGPMFGLVLDK